MLACVGVVDGSSGASRGSWSCADVRMFVMVRYAYDPSAAARTLAASSRSAAPSRRFRRSSS